MTTVEQLLLIVDRAERGSMLADEAVVLRAGIRALAAQQAREGGCMPVSGPKSQSASRARVAPQRGAQSRERANRREESEAKGMSAPELPPGDWRRAVYGRSQIGGIGTRRRPRAVDRERIIEQQGYKCLYCEIPISTVIWRRSQQVLLRAHWDHFIPYAYSQQNPSSNWVLACHVCNGIKTARMFNDVETARQVILPARIVKGYESPELVFHRLGLEREQGGPITRAARPTEKQLEALHLVATGASVASVAKQLGITHGSAQLRIVAAVRRLGATSTRDAIETARRNFFIPNETEAKPAPAEHPHA